MTDMIDLSQSRCAILGGGGFIGTNLCRALQGRVAGMKIFSRRLSFPPAVSGIEWISGDFEHTDKVAEAVAGCDTVFHLLTATTPASANLDMIGDLNANVAGTLRLLDACRAEGVRRIVYISSGGTIYGIPQQIPTPESAPTSPITAYGVTKLSVEKYLHLYHHLYGLEYRVLRVANPFGPYQTAIKNQGVIAAFMRHALRGESINVWGDGSIVRDYIFIDDVISAMLAAATHEGPSRVFNVGRGEGRSLTEIVEAIEQVSGLTIPVQYGAARAIDVPRSILDITLARRELGWQPQHDFLSGMQLTWDWMRSLS